MSTRRTFLSHLSASLAGLFVAAPVIKQPVRSRRPYRWNADLSKVEFEWDRERPCVFREQYFATSAPLTQESLDRTFQDLIREA